MVSVHDTGPGITPKTRNASLSPSRSSTGMLHHRTGGSGLGLSISKRFVELHDGKMWFESQVGVGTTFYFSIPTGISTDSTASQPKPVCAGSTAMSNISRAPVRTKRQATRFIPR